MNKLISRWFMFGLLLGWALTHATVFAQPAKNDAPADKLRAALEKKVTLDFTGQTLVEVLNHFRDKTGIPINIDHNALMQVGIDMPGGGGGFPGGGIFPPGGGGFGNAQPMQEIKIKAKDEKASQVLRRFLNAHQLSYIILDDAVLITTEEAGLMRQMRQRVSVDVDDVPFNKAVRSLAKNHGINLVIDPKVAKLAEANVSLQLESTGIETALRLLAEMASLKAVRMGNVMFITSEEKAEKIRKEESNQFDNPLNPNIPQTIPNMRFGIGGFGGAVMPMPARVAPGVPGVEVQPEKGAPDAPPPPPKKGETAPAQPPRPTPAPAPAVERPAGLPAPTTPRPRD
jgi:hypothetical protein